MADLVNYQGVHNWTNYFMFSTFKHSASSDGDGSLGEGITSSGTFGLEERRREFRLQGLFSISMS